MSLEKISLVLSSVSSSVRWVAFESATGRIFAERPWNDDQTRALSDSLGRELASMKLDFSRLENVCVLTGPGAFTGLRMGVSFAMGVARGLGLPLVGVPTWELFGRDFFIPTRHQLAKKLTIAECVAESMEFMHVVSPTSVDIEGPKDIANALVVGTLETPEWPSAAELVAAARRTLAASSPQLGASPVIFYGMEPKISGQR
jgi:hypothetical protein